MSLRIIYQDEYFVAIDKPSGYHVHPHEIIKNRVPRDKVCLYQVRDMLGQYVYPVHRLDAGTSGVLLFALSSDAARVLSGLFAERAIQKTYQAVVRGFVPDAGEMNAPLESDSSGELVEAITTYRCLAKVELPIAHGTRYKTSRYSWVEVHPLTGRWHQIRRHFNRISHPLLGDSEHGDTRQNQFFRKNFGIEGLCLKAQRLELQHPWTHQALAIEAPVCEKWGAIEAFFKASHGI